MEVFGELESAAGALYQYRWFIGAMALGVLAVAAWWMARRGVHRMVLRHPGWSGAIAAAFLAFAIPTGWYTLSPLWERSRLDEASPLAAASPSPDAVTPAGPVSATAASSATPVTTPFSAGVRHQGEFKGADDFHFGRGRAQVIESAPGKFVLRFEEFSVRNGPDLFVYLSRADHGGVDDAINLGSLKATDGAFNYDIPAGVDITQFRSAIVWCRQFGVLFARAVLARQGS